MGIRLNVIDLENLKEISDSDQEFISSIIDMGVDRLISIQENISNFSFEELKFHIHKLKSSLFYFLNNTEIVKYEKMETEIKESPDDAVYLWQNWFLPFIELLNKDLNKINK